MYKLFISFLFFYFMEKIIIKYIINDNMKNKLYLGNSQKYSSFLFGLDFIIVPLLIVLLGQKYIEENSLFFYFMIMCFVIGCFMIIRGNVYNQKITTYETVFDNNNYYIDFVSKISYLNMISFFIYSIILNDNSLFMLLNGIYIIIYCISLFPDKFSIYLRPYFDFRLKRDYFNFKVILIIFMILPIVIKILFIYL